jgi:N-formylglutamate deformylase
MLKTFEIEEGSVPLLISMPHIGTELPADIAGRMTPQALAVPDTDWYVDRLYDFARELGAWTIRPQYSRYVVDLNRPADGSLLYPGLRETSVCPTTAFDGAPLYVEGAAPDEKEVAARIAAYWRPYHATLATTLNALHVRFGYALLWDAHSILSEVPMLFEGRLPDFNLGTGQGQGEGQVQSSCPQPVAEKLLSICSAAANRTAVLNGRFKGGYITRHYGVPERGIWAVQLELSQRNYLDESNPRAGLTSAADLTRTVLRELLAAYLEAGRATRK